MGQDDTPFTPTPATDAAFDRWFLFMVWPGFGWLGIALAWYCLAQEWWLPAGALAYATLYVSLAFAWPGVLDRFWKRALGPERIKAILGLFAGLRLTPDEAPRPLLNITQPNGGAPKFDPSYARLQPERGPMRFLTPPRNGQEPPPLPRIDLYPVIQAIMVFMGNAIAFVFKHPRLIGALIAVLLVSMVWNTLSPIVRVIAAPFVWAIDLFSDDEEELRVRLHDEEKLHARTRVRVDLGAASLNASNQFETRVAETETIRRRAHERIEAVSRETPDAVMAAWIAGVRSLRDDAARARRAALRDFGSAEFGQSLRPA